MKLVQTEKLQLQKLLISNIESPTIECSARFENGETTSYLINHSAKPHIDLFNALQPFKTHLLFLAQILDEKKFSKEAFEEFNDEVDDMVDDVTIDGISLGAEGFTIAGERLLMGYNKAIKINLPKCSFYDLEFTREYKFIEILQEHMYALREEVTQYLNGKCESKQLEIFPEGDMDITISSGNTEVHTTMSEIAGIPAGVKVKRKKKKELPEAEAAE